MRLVSPRLLGRWSQHAHLGNTKNQSSAERGPNVTNPFDIDWLRRSREDLRVGDMDSHTHEGIPLDRVGGLKIAFRGA